MSLNLYLRLGNNLNLLQCGVYSKRGVETDNSKVWLQNCLFIGSRVDITFFETRGERNLFPSNGSYFLQFTDKIM